LFTSKMNNSR